MSNRPNDQASTFRPFHNRPAHYPETRPSVRAIMNRLTRTGERMLCNPFMLKDGALTLGNAISYSKDKPPWENKAYGDPSVTYGRHEEAHTYQSQVLGPLFIPTYLSNGLPSRHHPFEHAAQQWAKGKGHWWPW